MQKLSQKLYEFFSERIFALAPKWKGEVQTESLVFLNALSSQIDHQVDQKAFKLISSMVGREGRNLAAQLLFKSLENPQNCVKLNDNLLIQEEYKKLFDNWSQKNFLFMFHFASSEVILSENDFAERNSGATCLRYLVRKAQKFAQDYEKICNEEILPVLSKGLMAKNDRVQGEFIGVLTESLTEEGHLGSIKDLQILQNSQAEEETNFFDNMRHLQKHR